MGRLGVAERLGTCGFAVEMTSSELEKNHSMM